MESRSRAQDGCLTGTARTHTSRHTKYKIFFAFRNPKRRKPDWAGSQHEQRSLGNNGPETWTDTRIHEAHGSTGWGRGPSGIQQPGGIKGEDGMGPETRRVQEAAAYPCTRAGYGAGEWAYRQWQPWYASSSLQCTYFALSPFICFQDTNSHSVVRGGDESERVVESENVREKIIG